MVGVMERLTNHHTYVSTVSVMCARAVILWVAPIGKWVRAPPRGARSIRQAGVRRDATATSTVRDRAIEIGVLGS